MTTLHWRDIRILNPYAGTDQRGDLWLDGKQVVVDGEQTRSPAWTATESLEGRGLIAMPGMTDLYTRLGEPGYSRKGTIASESAAALAAGFTTIVCAADTLPAIDSVSTVQWIHERMLASPGANVLPMAAMTANLDGQQLSELATLQAAGCVAASQGDRPIASSLVLQRAMEYAATFDLPLILTPMDADLSDKGCAHAGSVATRLGLPGIPVTAETVEMTRLLELAGSIGCRLHLARLSSARAVALLQRAHDDGLAISASVGIHHLFFTHEQLTGFDARFHSKVPFRSITDRDALRRGVRDGIISTICSDHSPHELDARLAPFPASAAGLSAYDTFLPLLFTLPDILDMPLMSLLARVTSGPEQVIAPAGPSRGPEVDDNNRFGADLIVVDPEGFSGVHPDHMLSQGRNNPLADASEPGRSQFHFNKETIRLRAAVHGVYRNGQQMLPR